MNRSCGAGLVAGAAFMQLMMRFAGQVNKTKEAFLDQDGFPFFFFLRVVMVTAAAAGHFRTPSLWSGKKNISRARFDTRAQNGETHRRKQRAVEWRDAKRPHQWPLSAIITIYDTHYVSFTSGQSRCVLHCLCVCMCKRESQRDGGSRGRNNNKTHN